jgi:hypothetical protein
LATDIVDIYKGSGCCAEQETSQLHVDHRVVSPNPDDWCEQGGSRVRISFSLQGEQLSPGSSTTIVASGNFSAYFPDTGYRTQGLAGTVLSFPNAHQVFFDGTCETRDALGQVVAFGTGACTFFAADNTSNGAVDSLSAFSGSGSGYVQACCTPVSGNVNVE